MRTTRSVTVVLAAVAALLIVLPAPAPASGGPRTAQGVFEGPAHGSCFGFLTCDVTWNGVVCDETVVNGPALATNCEVDGNLRLNVSGNTLVCVGSGSGTAYVRTNALSGTVSMPISGTVVGEVVHFQGSAPNVTGDLSVRGTIALAGCDSLAGVAAGTFTAQIA